MATQAPENGAYSTNTNTSARDEREAANQRILARAAARRHIKNSDSAPPLTAAQLVTLTEAATNPAAYPDQPDSATRSSMTLAAFDLGRYLYACRRDLVATGECGPFEYYFDAQARIKREGIRITMLAAAQGHAAAQYELFFMLCMGADGRGGDKREAFMWLDRAAEQGHAAAISKREGIRNSTAENRIHYFVAEHA